MVGRLTAVGFGLAIAAGAGRGAEVGIPALAAVQRVEGFPGLEARETRVRLLLTRDRLFASRGFDGTIFLMQLDRERILEVAPDLKTYREWTEFQDLQKERRLFERQFVAALRQETDGPAFQAALRRHHLTEDGVPIVHVSEPGGARTFQVGERALSARRVVVTENGRTIVDAWYAPIPVDLAELAGPIPFYRFYRRLGCFSDPVLEALRAFSATHRGIPLDAQIRVVTATVNYVLKARTLQLGRVVVPPETFECPRGAHKVETERAVVKCAWPECRQQVETAAPAGGKYRDLQGRWYYFCSAEHRKRFIEQVKKRWREAREASEKEARSAGPGPPPPPGG